MVEEIIEDIEAEMEKHKNIKKKIRELKKLERERHKDSLKELNNRTCISDFQEDIIEQRKKFNEIQNKIEEVKEFAATVIGTLFENNYSGKRLTINKKVTIREGSVYEYQESFTADLGYMVCYNESIKEKGKEKLPEEKSQKLNNLLNTLEDILLPWKKDILFRNNPVISKEYHKDSYDYIFYTISSGCIGISSTSPHKDGDIPKFDSLQLVKYNSNSIGKEKICTTRENKNNIRNIINEMEEKLENIYSDLNKLEKQKKNFSKIIVSNEIA